MHIKHHLDEATLMSYAAGSLSQGMALVVACHLTMCRDCAKRLDSHQAIGGALLEQIAPTQVTENALEEVLAKLDLTTEKEAITTEQRFAQKKRLDNIQKSSIPAPLFDYIDSDFSELPWTKLGNSIAYYDIPCASSSGVSRLLRISPGKALLPHSHNGNELTLVLTGSFSDDMGRFEVGDIADLDDEVDHQPLVDSDIDCICLIATDAPLKFSTMFGKIIQPITGF